MAQSLTAVKLLKFDVVEEVESEAGSTSRIFSAAL